MVYKEGSFKIHKHIFGKQLHFIRHLIRWYEWFDDCPNLLG
jgi:hypothetical protein